MNYKSERRPETGGAITIGLPELMARLNSGRQTAEKVAAKEQAIAKRNEDVDVIKLSQRERRIVERLNGQR